MKRFVTVVLVACLAVPAVASASLRRAEVTAETYRAGFPAPVVTLAGLDGRSYTLGGRREKPVLVNFWVSWCGPCRLEAPDLQAIYEKYGDRIDVYGVNVTQADRADDVRRFVEHYGLKYPVLLDVEAVAADAYRIRAFPTSVIVDPGGAIRDRFYFARRDEMEKRLAAWIND